MGHQGSPLTEATSDGWDRPTLVYRLSCPGYFTTEPEPVPSPELDSTDELTCSVTGQIVSLIGKLKLKCMNYKYIYLI